VPPETSAKAPAAAPEDEPAEDEPAALEAADAEAGGGSMPAAVAMAVEAAEAADASDPTDEGGTADPLADKGSRGGNCGRNASREPSAPAVSAPAPLGVQLGVAPAPAPQLTPATPLAAAVDARCRSASLMRGDGRGPSGDLPRIMYGAP
jgi:hypothetical protein